MRIDRQALARWDKHIRDLKKSIPVDRSEHSGSKLQRIAELEKDWAKWMRYYFPNYCSKPFTKWQRRYADSVLTRGKRFIVRKVFRGGAKTTYTQMLAMHLILIKRVKNLLWVSKNQDAAIEMIRVLRLQFEGNPRLINDYGELKNLGAWNDDKFVTRTGASVRAIGKGQSPRGAKEEEARPDCIICDDVDDDEEVRNKSRLDDTFDWVMGALYGCFAVDGENLFIGLNNKIAPDCIIERLSNVKHADVETINLLNDKGKPTCPEWFTLKDCLYMIAQMGTRLSQREYFNNPVVEGKVFKADWIQKKKMLPLSNYQVLISYLDPSFKSGKNSDHKALILLGLVNGEIHIIKVWCAQATVQEMVMWHYELDDYVKARGGTVEMWMEEVFLQSLLYNDFNQAAKEVGYPIPIRGDTRKKPDKDARIEATSGHFERGQVYFNEEEFANHHMEQLIEQYLLFAQGTHGIKKDGPDAVEGAIFKAKEKIFVSAPPVIGTRNRNHKYRY